MTVKSVKNGRQIYRLHSMEIKEEVKYHRVLLEIIEQFNKPKWGKLISLNEDFNNKKARFKKFKKEFTVEFQYDIFSKKRKNLDLGEYHKGIQIQFGETTYNLERVFLGQHAPPKVTGSVDAIHSTGFSKKRKYYYQLIIPLKCQLKFDYHIEQKPFMSDLGYQSRTSTTAIVNGVQIQACCIHKNKKNYFLYIDSPVKQTYEEFAEKAHTVKIGMGYLSGHFAGDQGFFFANTRKTKKNPKFLYFVALRDSIQSGYSPIYSNAYGYLYRDQTSAKKYHSLLRPVSIDEFSELCNKIHNSVDFASVLMLILESSVASLLFMPGGYAIALETIADLVIGQTKLKLAPIKDKPVSRKIRKEFLDILDRYRTTIMPSDLAVLKKRIDQLNQKTNKARLRAPFELLEITLLDEDLQILETRNDFLHGRVPDIKNEGESRSTDRINKDLYYCSLRLYTLLNMVILKWIGYDNKIVNYPKIHEGYTQIKLNEEPFRQI